MSTIPITEHGAGVLKEELYRLKTKKRPATVSVIAEAHTQGDSSENAGYDAAKKHQDFIEGCIQKTENKLSAVQIIDPISLDADGYVALGAAIDLEDLDSGEPVTYQIAGDDEADLETGKISISSPIVRALIGRFEGDVATVVAPGDEREYEVLTVKYL